MINPALYIHFIDIFQAKSLTITKISRRMVCLVRRTNGDNQRRIQRQDTNYRESIYRDMIQSRICKSQSKSV
jgi:hypothetical protein